jgi:hypothetical protein
MDLLDFEIDIFVNLVRGQLAQDPGFTAVQTIPGIGPTLGRCYRHASADKLPHDRFRSVCLRCGLPQSAATFPEGAHHGAYQFPG